MLEVVKAMPEPAAPPPLPRRSLGRHILAAVLGISPAYGLALWMHVTLGRPYTLGEMLAYPLVFGGLSLVLIWVLLTKLCHERPSALVPGSGSLPRDLLEGLGLLVLLVALTIVELPTVYRWLPTSQRGDAGVLIRGLMRNPWLLALWLGPVVWVGVALFEEASRAFLLTRLWHIWTGRGARWLAVALSAALFGLVHIYQGAAGVASTAIFGLVMGAYFLHRGRLVPLVASHALYDTAWIVFGLLKMPR